MDDIIKVSIEERKAVFSIYNITDQKMINKIDNYFEKLNTFAYHYDNINDFENDFIDSELSKEYTDLLIEISNKYGTAENVVKDDTTHYVKQDVYDKVGKTMIIKQPFNFFSKLKNKKD